MDMKPKKGAPLPNRRMVKTYENLKTDNLRLAEDGGAQERRNANQMAEYLRRNANRYNTNV